MPGARKITVEFVGDSADLERSMSRVDSRGGRLSGTLKKVGKAAAIGLGVGVLAGGAALVKMTKAAVDDEAAQAKLAKTLENTTGANEQQIAAVEKWISAQGRALGVTDDELRPALERLLTATGDVSEAQRLASLAMDVSAGTGKSLESVSTALMKAQNGQVAGLSRLGIETKNAAGETLTFEQVVKSMSDTFEGQAATKADTLKGKIDRLKLILSETGETIGAHLIPKLTSLADWFLNKGLPAAMEFGGWIRDHLGPIFNSAREIIGKVMGGISGDVDGNLGKVRSIVSSVTSIIESLWDRFGANIVDFAKKTWANVKQVIGGALTIIQGIFQVFASALEGDWKGVWEGVKKILSGAWEVIKGVVRQALNIVGTIMENGWSAVKGIVAAAWDGIKTVVANGAAKVVDWIEEIPGKLRAKAGSFGAAGAALIGAFVDGMKNAGGVIEGIASNVWNAVRGLLNNAIDRINAALSFTISLPGPDLHVDVGNIGHLARGTNHWRGGLTWVGEEGPELVNLPRGSRVTPHDESMRALAAGAGGLAPTIVQLVLPGGKVIEQILIQHSRDTGRPLQVATLGPA